VICLGVICLGVICLRVICLAAICLGLMRQLPNTVIAALVAAIHVFLGPRDKPAGDEGEVTSFEVIDPSCCTRCGNPRLPGPAGQASTRPRVTVKGETRLQNHPPSVIAALVAAIHVFLDPRDKPEHVRG
jgi:hypothetical protein